MEDIKFKAKILGLEAEIQATFRITREYDEHGSFRCVDPYSLEFKVYFDEGDKPSFTEKTAGNLSGRIWALVNEAWALRKEPA